MNNAGLESEKKISNFKISYILIELFFLKKCHKEVSLIKVHRDSSHVLCPR